MSSAGPTPDASIDRVPGKEEDLQTAVVVGHSPASAGTLRHPNGGVLGVGRHRIRVSLQACRRIAGGKSVYGLSIGVSRCHFGGQKFRLSIRDWPNATLSVDSDGLKASGSAGKFSTLLFHGVRCPFKVAQHARRFVLLDADWDDAGQALRFQVPQWALDASPESAPAAELREAVKLVNSVMAKGGRAEIFDGRLRVFVPTFEVIE